MTTPTQTTGHAGEEIARRRKELKLTVEQLAGEAGLGRAGGHIVERAERSAAPTHAAAEILLALDALEGHTLPPAPVADTRTPKEIADADFEARKAGLAAKREERLRHWAEAEAKLVDHEAWRERRSAETRAALQAKHEATVKRNAAAGVRLHSLRLQTGLTVLEMAAWLDLSENLLDRAEHGAPVGIPLEPLIQKYEAAAKLSGGKAAPAKKASAKAGEK